MTSSTRPLALVTGASRRHRRRSRPRIGARRPRSGAHGAHGWHRWRRSPPSSRHTAPPASSSPPISAKPGAAAELADAIETRGLTVEVLVNNAGLGAIGRFDQTDPVRISEMLQVNIVALTELTRLLLPGMVAPRPRPGHAGGLDRRVSAGPGNGGLFRDQGLCAEPRRGARRGIARHRRHGDDTMSRSDRHQFRPNFRKQRTPVFSTAPCAT